MRLRNQLLFILVVLVWALSWSVTKTLLTFVSPLNALRQTFLFAAIALSPILLFNYRKLPRDGKSLGKLLVFSFISVASSVAMILGLSNEGSGMASVLVYTQPLFLFALAIPFLNEEVTSSKILGGAFGFVGIVVLSFRGLGLFSLESTIVLLLAALLWAVMNVFYKMHMTEIDPMFTNFFQLAVGAIVLSIVCLSMNDYAFPTSLNYLSILLYASIADYSVAYVIWLMLLRSEDATVLAGSIFVVPLIALFFGSILLGESIDAKSVLGSALVLVGVYLVNVNKKSS